MTRYAYVEFGSSGHRPIWIRAVTEAFTKVLPDAHIDVWVPKGFTEIHKSWALSNGGLKGVAFRENDQSPAGVRPIEVVKRCAAETGAAVAFVANNLDALVRDVALAPPGWLGTRIVGVMDQPWLHYRRLSKSANEGWLRSQSRTAAWLKNLIALRRPIVSEVLMLDPYAAPFYNDMFRTSKCRYLPEYLGHNSPGTLSKESLGLPVDRIIILFIGATEGRKGIVELLGAIERVFEDDEICERVSLVIAGRTLPDTKPAIDATIQRLRHTYRRADVRTFDRDLTDEEFSSFVSAADLVCLPYIRFVGTSGILMHAAGAGKLVLASEFGLLGELVRKHQLGVVCNSEKPSEVAVALVRAVDMALRMSQSDRARLQDTARTYGVPLSDFGRLICESLRRAGRADVRH